jgi:penicillin amidase
LYLTPEGWQPFIRLEEVVKVDGEKDDTVQVKLTRNGPILIENDSLKTVYSFRWAGSDMDLCRAAQSGFDLASTTNFQSFRKTVTKFGALDANWTYADSAGNIGYQLGTPIPVRPDSLGILPAPGWKKEYEWLGYRALEETPYSYNPSRGWLATCNNKQDSDLLGYDLQGNFFSDRISRITELLNSKEKFSLSDMQKFQQDRIDAYLLRWKQKIIPKLLEQGFSSVVERIKEWDGSNTRDSWPAAFVNVFLRTYKYEILGDDLGDLAKSISYTWVEALFDEGDPFWFDNKGTKDKVESKSEVFKKSVLLTLERVGDHTWGDFNSLKMRHPLAIIPVISEILGLEHGPYSWEGTRGTLNSSFSTENEDGTFSTIVGPSWRFVIDFSNPDAAMMNIPAGNSGHPFSPHFMDFFEMWSSGQYWNVPISRASVLKKTVKRLRLIPEGDREKNDV